MAPEILLPLAPALQKLGHRETQGAGVRLCSWERTENRVRRGAKKQSTHKRVQFHVFIFGRKEIIANLLTDNARPWKRAHSTCSISPVMLDCLHIQMSNRNP